MIYTKEVLVTNVYNEEGRVHGFGITVDSNERVYIPGSMVNSGTITVNDENRIGTFRLTNNMSEGRDGFVANIFCNWSDEEEVKSDADLVGDAEYIEELEAENEDLEKKVAELEKQVELYKRRSELPWGPGGNEVVRRVFEEDDSQEWYTTEEVQQKLADAGYSTTSIGPYISAAMRSGQIVRTGIRGKYAYKRADK